MDKYLKGCFQAQISRFQRLEFLDFLDRKFAGEDGAFHRKKRLDERQPFRRGDRHLRRSMQLDVRSDRARKLCQPEVLDDQRVHSGGRDPPELVLGGFHFTGENEGIHRHESFDAVAVQELHQLLEIRLDEIVGAQPGIEARQAEIDRIRPGGHGGTGAVPVPCRGKKFGCRVGGHGGVKHGNGAENSRYTT